MNANLSGILAILIWSSLTTLVSMTGGLPGFQLAAMTFFIGFIIILVSQKIMGIPVWKEWKNSAQTYIFVTAGIGVYTALLFLSFKLIHPFEANTLNYTWPILLALFISVLQRQSISTHQILGIILGFTGVAAIFWKGFDIPVFSIGHITALSAAILWALYSSYAKKFSYSVFFLVPVFLLSGILCLVFHLMFEKTVVPTGFQAALILILGIMRISYLMWDHGVRKGNAIILSSLAYFIPFLSTCLMVVSGFRPADSGIALGAGLILLGCLITNWPGIKRLLNRS